LVAGCRAPRAFPHRSARKTLPARRPRGLIVLPSLKRPLPLENLPSSSGLLLRCDEAKGPFFFLNLVSLTLSCAAITSSALRSVEVIASPREKFARDAAVRFQIALEKTRGTHPDHEFEIPATRPQIGERLVPTFQCGRPVQLTACNHDWGPERLAALVGEKGESRSRRPLPGTLRRAFSKCFHGLESSGRKESRSRKLSFAPLPRTPYVQLQG